MSQPNQFYSNMKFAFFLVGISFLSLGIYDLYNLSIMEYQSAVETANVPELLLSTIGGCAFLIIGIVMHLKQNKDVDK